MSQFFLKHNNDMGMLVLLHDANVL